MTETIDIKALIRVSTFAKLNDRSAPWVHNLAKALAKSIDEYKSKHSDVTDEMVQESLNIIFLENTSNNFQK